MLGFAGVYPTHGPLFLVYISVQPYLDFDDHRRENMNQK